MDIIKRILCLTLLGDLIYFDKKVKDLNEVSTIYRILRIQAWIVLISMITLVSLSILLHIPLIKFIVLILFFIALIICLMIYVVYSLIRNIIILVGYKDLNLEKFENIEVEYLKSFKTCNILSLVIYIAIVIFILFLIISMLIGSLFSMVFVVLIFRILLIICIVVKFVFYVKARINLYKIIKSDEY
ncbi:MAG: hypothetical protein ACK5HR_03840 [Mycoplasmatales bacterium]